MITLKRRETRERSRNYHEKVQPEFFVLQIWQSFAVSQSSGKRDVCFLFLGSSFLHPVRRNGTLLLPVKKQGRGSRIPGARASVKKQQMRPNAHPPAGAGAMRKARNVFINQKARLLLRQQRAVLFAAPQRPKSSGFPRRHRGKRREKPKLAHKSFEILN